MSDALIFPGFRIQGSEAKPKRRMLDPEPRHEVTEARSASSDPQPIIIDLFKFCGCGHHHLPDHGQTFPAALIERVLRRVMIAPERRQIDNVDCGKSSGKER